VLTAAHVLKGADEIVVSDAERTTTGTIVGFDPQMDLALVRLADPLGDVVPLADLADLAEADVEGADGVAFVMRAGAIVEIPVTVERQINLRTEDIYVDGEYDRPAWELAGATKAGDSGGAVVVDGHVIGVLSLRSNRYESRAYAIDPVRAGATIRTQLDSGDLGPVDLTRCT
jgi:S1-C subfamily serine protease